jgi:hypothetical protein
MLTAYGLVPVAPVGEEARRRVLPVACPRRDLWRYPLDRFVFYDWFFCLEGAKFYVFFTGSSINLQHLSAKGFKLDSLIVQEFAFCDWPEVPVVQG